MSTSAELLKPLPAPVAPERASPARSEDNARAQREEGTRFAEKLDRERTDKPVREQRDAVRDTEPSDAPARSGGDDASVNAGDEPVREAMPGDDAATVETGEPENAQAQSDTQATAMTELLMQAPDVEGPQELVLTALSGQAMALTPPQAAASTEPGALGRWFMQAAGPVGSQIVGQAAQQAGVLNQDLALGVASPSTLDLEGMSNPAAQSKLAGPANTDFTDALASSSLTSSTTPESFEALITQAAAKASAGVEAITASAPTPGQMVTTGAQPAMTAVPQAAAGQAVPVAAIAVEITRQAANGKTQFDIRLDPPELGRLNVRLEMDASGQTRTHMIVERAETLDMIATDARSLERALQQAGLKVDPGSVSFELAGDGMDGFSDGSQNAQNDEQGADKDSGGNPANADPLFGAEDIAASPEAIRQQLYVTGHLDVRV
ncbi:MAG: flagellar hook-length control protein FliK [Devosiaceae bacterium]